MKIGRLVSLLVIVAIVPAVATAEQVCLYNPNGREVWAVGAMDPAKAGVRGDGCVAFSG